MLIFYKKFDKSNDLTVGQTLFTPFSYITVSPVSQADAMFTAREREYRCKKTKITKTSILRLGFYIYYFGNPSEL